MKLALLLSAALLALASSLSPVHAQSCGARVRKDWDVLTTAEKDTYKGALAAAMDSGAYIKFVEMHTEMMSEREAHQQCMFIYWHRLLLVAFENMLRGQGSQYACVTVPYYNWVDANNRFSAGTCSSLGDCSTITAELGGYTTGSQRTVSINGVSNSGRCVTQSPLDHRTSTPRENRIGRGRERAHGAVKTGVHVVVAALLHRRRHRSDVPTAENLLTNGCETRTSRHRSRTPSTTRNAASTGGSNGGAFNPTDVIVMRTGVNGRNPIEGSQDPLIGRYFSGVPNQFAGLMDVRDLGDSSYTYELSGQLADMYTNCDGTSTPAPTTASPRPTTAAPTNVLQPVTSAPIPITSAPIAPTAGPQQPRRWSWLDWLRNRWGFGNGRRLEAEHGWAWPWGHRVQRSNIRGSDCDDNKQVDQSNSIDQNSKNDNVDVITVDRTCPEEQRVSSWYSQTATKMGGDCPEVMADLERQMCMFQNQCLGGTPDYSPEFKTLWGAKSPRCFTIVNAINSGEQKISYANWRQDMESHLGCPKPANATQFVDQHGGYNDAAQSVTDTISSAVQSV